MIERWDALSHQLSLRYAYVLHNVLWRGLKKVAIFSDRDFHSDHTTTINAEARAVEGESVFIHSYIYIYKYI